MICTYKEYLDFTEYPPPQIEHDVEDSTLRQMARQIELEVTEDALSRGVKITVTGILDHLETLLEDEISEYEDAKSIRETNAAHMPGRW